MTVFGITFHMSYLKNTKGLSKFSWTRCSLRHSRNPRDLYHASILRGAHSWRTRGKVHAGDDDLYLIKTKHPRHVRASGTWSMTAQSAHIKMRHCDYVSTTHPNTCVVWVDCWNASTDNDLLRMSTLLPKFVSEDSDWRKCFIGTGPPAWIHRSTWLEHLSSRENTLGRKEHCTKCYAEV